jgi:hypothetical protein
MRAMFLVTAVAALALPSIVNAQASPMVRANIPFAFNTGAVEMPAGEYDILVVFRDVLLLTPKDRSDGVFVQRSVSSPVKPLKTAQMVFNYYPNGKYFLSQIWLTNKDEVSDMTKCKEEKEIVTSTLHAGLKSTRVVVLARVAR